MSFFETQCGAEMYWVRSVQGLKWTVTIQITVSMCVLCDPRVNQLWRVEHTLLWCLLVIVFVMVWMGYYTVWKSSNMQCEMFIGIAVSNSCHLSTFHMHNYVNLWVRCKTCVWHHNYTASSAHVAQKHYTGSGTVHYMYWVTLYGTVRYGTVHRRFRSSAVARSTMALPCCAVLNPVLCERTFTHCTSHKLSVLTFYRCGKTWISSENSLWIVWSVVFHFVIARLLIFS